MILMMMMIDYNTIAICRKFVFTYITSDATAVPLVQTGTYGRSRVYMHMGVGQVGYGCGRRRLLQST